ncbi:hypothetical protein [Sedimenticola selenatireducens]|uniref:Uncharacterized protein n=1 Tax=Sedimenticola selenatireducens TaxID=191960 RepID=A0A558DRT1_9GAMM|nr:hypothetical protein [Sedimenticola selenatireducens]TVO75888.1 hypothetical protein FHP88_07770 [Sedimenticola selenatireducens]TVT63747.1 MAG: hypothetical protein FHK78_10470 [Sedimenticola selenatireducens]
MKLEMKTINGKPTILYNGKTAEERLRERPEYKGLSPEEFKAKVREETKAMVEQVFREQAGQRVDH